MLFFQWLRLLAGAALLLSMAAVVRPAHADPALEELEQGSGEEEGEAFTADTPWGKGVPIEQRRAANEPFQQGNSDLKDGLFKPAADKYREALAHWDHPGIHFNLALALMSLDKPVEVYQHLQKAIEYGPGPINADKVERAESYIKLLEQQLAQVIVRCDEPGAKVRMDGQLLFTAPGKYEAWVRVGEHTWSAIKEGYERTQKSQVLSAKQKVVVDLNLYRPEELTRTKRRFAGWVPVVPIVTGALVVGGGVALNFLAYEKVAEFENGLTDDCGLSSSQRSCPPNSDLTSRKERAELYQNLSTASYIVGGAAVTTGLVLFSLNRPTRYKLTPSELDSRRIAETAVVPWVSPEGGGFVARGRF